MAVDRGTDEAWQSAVDERFGREAPQWRDAYGRGSDVRGEAHRSRLRVATAMLERACPSGARIVDLGCGPGAASVALARAGFVVTAVDHSPAMADLTTAQVRDAGLADRVTVRKADAHALPFASHTFDGAMALGLLPWSHSPQHIVREMARIVRPGGHVVATVSNSQQLARLLDPSRMVVIAMRAARDRRAGSHQGVPHRLNTLRELLALLEDAGLTPIEIGAVGYGPFTALARVVVPDRVGRWAQRRLEGWARQNRALRRAASQLIVLANRPADS